MEFSSLFSELNDEKCIWNDVITHLLTSFLQIEQARFMWPLGQFAQACGSTTLQIRSYSSVG